MVSRFCAPTLIRNTRCGAAVEFSVARRRVRPPVESSSRSGLPAPFSSVSTPSRGARQPAGLTTGEPSGVRKSGAEQVARRLLVVLQDAGTNGSAFAETAVRARTDGASGQAGRAPQPILSALSARRAMSAGSGRCRRPAHGRPSTQGTSKGRLPSAISGEMVSAS